MSEPTRGRIFSEFWISCGRCEFQMPLAAEKNGRKAATEHGWVFRKAFGWICPECAEEHVRARGSTALAAIQMGLNANSVGYHQGFATSTGRFVLRDEALSIAKRADQFVRKPDNASNLFSEDVW